MGEARNDDSSVVKDYGRRLERAEGYGEVWDIVKDTAKSSLGKERAGMLLFLDDLPLRLGAYHSLGTNNIVLNRSLVQVVEATTRSKRLRNAFVYVLLLHEYLHALGFIRESKVRPLVYRISRESFGEDHVASKLAEAGPWSLLKDIPLDAIEVRKQVMEIVKDFEKANQRYIA